ncbi:quinon protein alcohol dehydrogenase-like superfamily [Xylaria sp. FL0043]|nr:quinon protein alcohol dehydrogenase-like superfamily [Xylaria sp. FL0043]
MAPFTTPEAAANKRKRELDEHSKRKRRKQGLTSTQTDLANGKSINSELAVKVNGAEDITNREGKILDVVKSETKAEKKEKRQKIKKALAAREDVCKWRVSKPIGGRMLNIDPILTEDEKHLILAYNMSLQVYLAPESLLLRKIELPLSRIDGRRDQIAAVCPSATSADLLWVASYGGWIWLIDWTTGAVSDEHIELDCDRLHDMSVDAVEIGSDSRDLLYVSSRKEETWHITAYDVQDLELAGSKTVFSHTSAIENLRVAHLGHTFAAYADQTVIVGSRKNETTTTLEDLAYEVVSFDAGDEITCLDVQVTARVHLSRRSQREANDIPVVDLAIGCARGAILVYNDLLPKFRLLNNPKMRHHALQPRKYHWHRKAVHAAKWSQDGNYILSGGSESTLVLWQLDTQKKDFLPHLSATIENIVVSKRGSAYALHLNDNSTMVLSTAEMKPITYISGIQAMLSPQPISKDDTVRRVGQHTPDRLQSIPAAISPSNPSQMLLCVGNGQQLSYSGSGPSMPLIQALDLTTMQSISTQALTRTNPTDVNTTARGHPITEPRVTRMKFSHDGRWLVTTDEWQPPSRDINSLDGFSSDRRETYLKFWSVSAESKNLELMTRIDAPHHSNQVESVFDLAADPKSDRFATIGGDGIARLWQPTIRQRDGLFIKGKMGRQLYSWNCSQAITLYGNETTGELEIPNEYFQGSGAVAFSEDGSVLVCAVVHEHGSIIQVIDTESGRIRNSLNGLIKGNIQGISVISTDLVVLSDALMVYDLVLDELRYGVQLRKAKGSETEDLHGPGASLMNQLATDFQTGRFAVAVSRGKKGSNKVRSELAIFAPNVCEPELVQSFSNPITSLISSPDSSGFLVLDSAAQLWSIVDSMDTKSLAFAYPLADLQLDQEPVANGEVATTSGLVLEEEDDDQPSEDDMDVDMADAADDDTTYPAVVAPQKLAELFDIAPSFAMPPIEDMFYQVTKLFSTKTVVPAS